MGSPEDEPERSGREGPQHQVRIAQPLALGKYAITFADYDRYAAAAGLKKPQDRGWGRGRRPVINALTLKTPRAIAVGSRSKPGRVTACPRKRNGNTLAGRGL